MEPELGGLLENEREEMREGGKKKKKKKRKDEDVCSAVLQKWGESFGAQDVRDSRGRCTMADIAS